MSRETLLNNVTELVKKQLKPLVEDIDRKGLYPEDFAQFGSRRRFCVSRQRRRGRYGLRVGDADCRIAGGQECGATSFSAWCQAACAWYLHRSPNPEVKEKYLAEILQGGILAGTGMSMQIKHLAGIEKHNLQAVRADGSYCQRNLAVGVEYRRKEHIWANTAQDDDIYVDVYHQ